jgi:pyruvate,water dikinase
LTVLQARPITSVASRAADERSRYLALRPGDRRLEQLCERVVGSLIPALEAEGSRLHAQRLDDLPDDALADAVDERAAAVRKWRRIYREEFIPFAHGVRRLGTYYNDAVKPDDPYEFLGVLKGEKMLATERNRVLAELADEVRGREDLCRLLHDAGPTLRGDEEWRTFASAAAQLPGGASFARRLQAFVREHFDLAFDDERLGARPDIAMHAVLRLAQAGPQQAPPKPSVVSVADLEQRLRDAVGDERRQEADEILKVGRLSWRLRDDDNILLGRLEAQLLHSLEVAAQRLTGDGRMAPGVAPAESLVEEMTKCLRGRTTRVDVSLREREESEPPAGPVGESARQLVGQPAAPGLARGRVRVVRAASDLVAFEAGEVLVCDAIQPTMTHLVPLAAAIVERRGGMLIHGAIIARELGIPCVNGIRDALAIFHDGEVVAVDGDLGIVSIGEPELDLELR